MDNSVTQDDDDGGKIKLVSNSVLFQKISTLPRRLYMNPSFSLKNFSLA